MDNCLKSKPSKGHHELAMAIFAILFVSPKAVSMSHLRSAMNIPEEVMAESLALLKSFLKEYTPLYLQEFNDNLQLATRPDFAPYIKAIVDIVGQKRKLSEEALMTLAVIAYHQPVRKTTIDEVRGIDAQKTLETLMKSGLIEQLGNLNEPGSPVAYATTNEFLKRLGLKSLSDLPPLTLTNRSEN